MQLNPGERLGPYEIVGSVGAGGMGEVYKARDTRLDRSVAVKILPADFAGNAQLRLRFEREAKTISQLNHPNICTLYDVGENFIVMELLEGESLADRLLKGPLPIRETLKYAIQIADALDRAHRAGVVHRDLKPGNIMITRSGAKLLDFGLAKSAPLSGSVSADEATQQQPLTGEGMIVGTLNYMAPEQVQGFAVDQRTDLFAFGAVVYEMITGRRAFEGKSKASVIAALLQHDPPSVSALQPVTPPALDRLVRICLDKDPEERWQSAHDLKRELEWIQSSSSSTTGTSVPLARSARKSLRIAAAVAIALLIAAAAWLVAQRGTRPPVRIVSNLVPPPGSQFMVMGDAAAPMTLSPDGRYAVFGALTKDGSRLWLQNLTTGSATPLRGTERAAFPFWSPDSGSIGFFADSKLLVMDIDGSSPRAIADAADARGGCWGTNGDILFTPFTRALIYRVAASGGTPVAVTKFESPYTTDRWPSFLPDGKHFVFLAANHAAPESPDTAIFLGSTDGAKPLKLVNTMSSGFVYGDRLIYANGGKLVAQRLTTKGLEGPRVTLWSGALTDPGTWRTVASASSTGILAMYPSAGRALSRLVWLDRSGRQIAEIQPPQVYRDVALSPDGTKIALAIGDPESAIYVQDVAKGVRTRFSFVKGAAANPVWTRDGRTIVFASWVSTNRFELFAKPADGTLAERSLFHDADSLRPTDVTPDGRVILDISDQWDVITVPLGGGNATPLIAGAGQQNSGVVSPDGRWILYVNVDSNGRGAFVAPYPSLATKWQVSTDSALLPTWSRNGKEITYLTSDGQFKSVAVTAHGESIDLGTPVTLFHLNVNTNRRPIANTPDGSRFLVIDPQFDAISSATLVTNFDLALK